MISRVLLFMAVVLGLLTMLPFLPANAWWVRIWDFPRPQMFLVALILLPVVLSIRFSQRTLKMGATAILLGVVLAQAWKVLPFTPLNTREVQSSGRAESDRNITMLCSNVLMSNEESSELAGQIETLKPSLVLLTECDERWLEELRPVTESYPYKVEKPLSNTYGMALYSQFELVEPEIKFLLENDIPSIHSKLVLPSQEMIKIYCLHPRPPAPQESDSTAQRDAELILVAKETGKLNMPVIVMGDLNDVAWSPTTSLFQSRSGLLDPRVGRGLYSTFHAQIPFLRFPLDHIFHSSHFRLAELRVEPDIGSDHFPIFVNLSLENSAPKLQPTPTPTPGTNENAEQIIKEGFQEELEEEQGED